MPRLSRVLALGWHYRPLLLRAGIVVVIFRLGLFIFPYRRLKSWIPTVAPSAVSMDQLRALMWSIRQVARLVPRASCLTQALAGQYLCARSGVATRIRIGVANTDGHIRAHAWLMAGETVLIGGSNETLADFTTLIDLGHAPL